MNIKKYKQSGMKNLQTHLEHSSANKEVYNTSHSLINPTMTKYNYNLCDFDMMQRFNELKEQSYARNKDTVVALSLIVTLPKDYTGDPKDFFQIAFEELQKKPEFKHCISAKVHCDESTPHMHYVFMPLEEKEKTVKKREKVFDEKKNKTVSRNVEHKYKYCFNAKGIIDKNFLEDLHPDMQKRMNDRGIDATIITPARVAFNEWKNARLLEANKQIELHPEDKERIVNEFWKEWQEHNPHDYKRKNKDKPKDFRLAMFEDMVKNAFIEEYKQIRKEKQKELESFRAEQNKVVETEKELIFNSADKEINDYILDTNNRVAEKEQKIKEDAKAKIEKIKLETKIKHEEEYKTAIENLEKLEKELKRIEELVEEKEKYKKDYLETTEDGKIKNQEVNDLLKLKNIFDKEPTKEEYNKLATMCKNSIVLFQEAESKSKRKDNAYNDLVDKYNSREDEFQNIFDTEIERITQEFKNKYEQLKSFFFDILKKFGIEKPFERLNEKEQMQSVKAQVEQNAFYYEYGKNAITSKSSSDGIKKNPEYFKDNDEPELVR